jgi:hypothetical protein
VTRKHLGGWARHTTCILSKEKQRLSSVIGGLEELPEVLPLSTHEIEVKRQTNAHIARLLHERSSNGNIVLKPNSYREGNKNT